MKRRKLLILMIIFLAFNFTLAQKIKVDFIIKNDSLPKKEKKNFIYLDKQTDISAAKYIGRIKATSKLNDIALSIIFISDKAKKKGANAFKFVDFKNENGTSELLIDTYVIDDNIKNSNENLLPKDKIYFFGKDNMEKNSIEEFKLNGEIKKLNSFHYSVVDFDKKMTISKGKAFGTTLRLNPQNNDCVFINFTGFGASPNYAPSGGIGISFSGGSIIRMEKDTGLLLTHIFTKQE